MNITRWFLKTIYRLFRGKQYGHNKNYWYLFDARRDTDSRIISLTYKGRRIKLVKSLSGKKKSDRLILIATGPSVRDINQNWLKSTCSDIIGVNGAIALRGVCFSYYCIIDPSFIRNRIDMVRAILRNQNLTLFCNPPVLHEIMQSCKRHEIKCSFWLMDMIVNNICYPLGAKQSYIDPENDPHHHWHNGFGFSSDIHKSIFDYGTVTYPALQIACSLGYKKIMIAGLDMNNFGRPRFYESVYDKLPTNLDRDFVSIQGAFCAAASYCDSNNIEVLNLSPGSAIKAFNMGVLD